MSRDALASMVIGLGASLAGMIYPFRRGILGVIANISAAVLGALGGSFAAGPLLVHQHEAAALRLFFAALGAISGMAIVHAVYARVIVLKTRGARRGRSDARHRAV